MSDYEIAADVAPGGLLEIYDVRILICYLLDSVDKPMTKDQLNHIFREERVVQYFTFSDALAQLVQDGHLSVQVKDGEEYYQLEPLGKGTAKRLQSVLSRAMRERIVRSAVALLQKQTIEQENHAKIVPSGKGFEVQCSVGDGILTLLRFSLYVPDEMQARMVQKKFMKDPLKLYQAVLQELILDEDSDSNQE